MTPSRADALTRPPARRGLAATAVYLVPPAIAAAAAFLVMISCAGSLAGGTSVLAGGIVLVGLAAGALAGGAASAAERRTVTREYQQRLDDLDHDLRAPMTIIRGEVELVLNQDDVPIVERGRSCTTIIGELERLEHRLRQEHRT
jgi:signal transduction histidine kinase